MGLVALNSVVKTVFDFSTYGMISVIALLVLLVALVVIYGTVLLNNNKPKIAKSENAAFVAAPAKSIQDEDEIIAVIAAAVAAMYDGTGKSAVIRSVRPSIKPNRSVWSAAGIYENTRAF